MAITRHPRAIISERAEAEMAKAITEIVAKHELTCGEVLAALAAIQMRWAQYQVRDDRAE